MAVGIGDVVDGKYEIVSLLGEGGMGAVYEGLNTRIHRRVAIKVLHAEVATNEEAMTRFEREAQAAGRIGSEHIVEVLDLGDLPGGERYMVMEFLEGESLRDRMARAPMAPRDIGSLAVGMLEGLKAAHGAGITHRDLKPDNVFLLSNRGGKKDFVKIVDFGISKFSALGGEFSMTRTGAVMGTPYYMAPEQAKGGSGIDHRVDLYAAGVILYQAVVGKVPFDAETFNELLFKIVLEQPRPLVECVQGIDPDFVKIVEKSMARAPGDRYQTAEEFQNALRSWLGGSHVAAGKTMAAGSPAAPSGALPGAAMAHPTQLGAPAQVVQPSTQGAWANTDMGGERLPVRKGPSPMIWAGAGAAVLAVVVAVVAMSGESGVDEAARAAAAQAEEAKAEAEKAAEEERQQALQALEEERKKAEEARLKAEEARKEAEKNKSDLEAQKRAAAARQEAEAQEASAAQAAARAAQRTPRPQAVAPRPLPQPRPAAPAPKPAAAPTSGGRPIRTEL